MSTNRLEAFSDGVFAIAASIGLVACGSGGGSSSSSSSSASGETGGGESGGTLNVTYASFPDYMDPGLSYTAEGWTAMGEVYIPLLTYKHAEGTEGTEAGGRRHHHRLLYTCWHDGAGNYVHGNWSWFTCWRCGALNYM